jgi:hypothetical protein
VWMLCLGNVFRPPRHHGRVPHTPDFLCSVVGSLHFMRPSLKKGAHVVLSRAVYRKFGASRSFFARCGIPLHSPSSLRRIPRLRGGYPSVLEEAMHTGASRKLTTDQLDDTLRGACPVLGQDPSLAG